MRIAIGNGTAIGRHSIGLGDETDARTFDVEESRGSDLDNLTYDMMTDTFIPSDTQETSLQSPSSGDFTSSLPFQHMSSEIPPTTRKRNRMEFDGKSTSFETNKAQT